MRNHDFIGVIRGLPEPPAADICEIPCIFPCYQGIGRGDWFALHWLVSQPVPSPGVEVSQARKSPYFAANLTKYVCSACPFSPRQPRTWAGFSGRHLKSSHFQEM